MGSRQGSQPPVSSLDVQVQIPECFLSCFECRVEKEFFIVNLLVRVHFIMAMIRWTGLAPWEFGFPFPGSLTSTFQVVHGGHLILKFRGFLLLANHTVEYDPFHQKSTCLAQLTLGPYVVQIWSRNTPESGVNETHVLHRVDGRKMLRLRC